MESSVTAGSANNKKRLRFRRSLWKPEEDDVLIHLVKRHGPCKWNQIAKHIPPRTGASCRVRWVNQLKPGVNKLPFSGEENRKLLQLHKKYGNMWSTINDFFHGRTDNQMKNQYNFLMRNKCHGISNMLPNAYSRGTLNRGVFSTSSKELSISAFHGFSGLDNKFTSCPHGYTIEMPSSAGGSTFSWRRAEDLLAAHFSSSFCEFHQSSFLMYGGSTYLKIYPRVQRQQELAVKEHKLIDFLGVGNPVS